MLYELKNIQQVFAGRTALNIVQLAIEAGKIYTLIGPNGAGKTTLLNLLAFLEEPSSGELYFHDERVAYSSGSLLGLRRRVVLLDQYPILFTGPVWKNVEYGLKVRGVAASERRTRVIEMLDLVGMQHFIEAEAHKLSGGETKRVALARALALRPDVLLCDEPGANVDQENQEIILSILSKINQTEQTSIIFSTHYLSQGRSLADHTLMLEHGSLSDMVHENVYRVRVVRHENGRVFFQLTGGLLLSLPDDRVPSSAENIKLQIDPDAIFVVASGDGNVEEQRLSGHVVQVNQDRGRIRICIDVGVKLYIFLAMTEYLKNPPAIGGKITVALPDSSMRCGSSW